MGSRYGRNKRRRDRRQISELCQTVGRLEASERALRAQVADAEERGATRILRAKYLNEMVKHISMELARAYGPEIIGPLNELMRSHRRPGPVIELQARFDPLEVRVSHIRGVIRELHYNVAIPNY